MSREEAYALLGAQTLHIAHLRARLEQAAAECIAPLDRMSRYNGILLSAQVRLAKEPMTAFIAQGYQQVSDAARRGLSKATQELAQISAQVWRNEQKKEIFLWQR